MPLFNDNELTDLMGGVRAAIQDVIPNQAAARLQNNAATPLGLGGFAQQAVQGWDAAQGAFGTIVGQPSMVDYSRDTIFGNLNNLRGDEAAYWTGKARQDAADQANSGGIIGWIQDKFGNSQPVYGKPHGNTGSGDFGGGPSTGLDPNVARWADQTTKTFGDIQGLDPDVMLAIMTNESGGDPNVQNHQGYPAYGLFQLWNQPGLNADQQFTAAHQLAIQKMDLINKAYAAHGINPDARTRARDFALAWAGQFDPATAGPNASSQDVGSGQTAQELANVFLSNYDKIKAGRQQQAAPGGGTTVNGVTIDREGYAFPVVGYTQHVQLHHGTEPGASDIMAPRGSPIVAMRGGRVVDASWNSLGGNTVTIEGDDGLTYYYAHMDQVPTVRTGDVIKTGTGIGVVGDTGNAVGTGTHLHLGIGHGIQNGAGPTGGAGIDYNAVDLLNSTIDQIYGQQP